MSASVTSPSTPPLRQSSRTRKPSRRAEEMSAAAVGSTTPVTAQPQKEARARSASNPSKSKSKTESDNNVDDVLDLGDEKEEDEEDDEEGESAEEDSEGSVYCVCRSKDDGRPMVLCAACDDWFHFSCVGLTKKTAASITEFICSSCERATGRQSKDAGDTSHPTFVAAAGVQTDGVASPKRKREDDETTIKRSKPSPPKEVTPSVQAQAPSEPTPSSSSAPTVQSMRRTSISVKPKSTSSSSTSGSSASSVLRARSETLRKHAEQQFVVLFGEVMSEAAVADADDAAQEYAHDVETALFNLTSEAAGPVAAKANFRVAGKAYRDKLRSLLFNLKDKSNQTLRAKIADGTLPAKDLSSMSSEQLANDAIRLEVERRKRENLEQSILKKEKAPLRKLTHKGEIDIEYENAQVHRMDDEQHGDRSSRDDDHHQSASSPVEGAFEGVSTSSTSIGMREGVASGKAVLSPQGSPQAASKSVASRTSQSVQSPTLQFDFSHVWQGDRPLEEHEEDEKAEEEAKADDGHQSNAGQESLVVESENEQEADNFIDDFLGMQEGDDQVLPKKGSVQAEDQTSIDVTDVSDTASKWQGSIDMPDVGAFSCAVRQIAGRALADEDWNNLLPSSTSLVEGRLPSGAAIPYLLQSHTAASTELVVMTGEVQWVPSAMPEGSPIKSVDANGHSFSHLLQYFTTRDRYGVLQPLREARKRAVKDFYLVSLPKDRAIPEWLAVLPSNSLSGERAKSRDQDLFLLVAVLFKQQSRAPSATQGPENTPIDLSRSPPINVSSMLGPGSTTLQDLLRAVGSTPRNGPGATPPTPYGGAGFQSPANNGQSGGYGPQPAAVLTQDGMVPASSMQALGAMPKPQLDDLLTKNPTLVEDLLKTLGRTGGAPPRPGPPPGPPPARPALGDNVGRPGPPPVRPAYDAPQYGAHNAYPPSAPSGQYSAYGGRGSPAEYYHNAAPGYASPSGQMSQPGAAGYAPYPQAPSGPRRDVYGYGGPNQRADGGQGRGRW